MRLVSLALLVLATAATAYADPVVVKARHDDVDAKVTVPEKSHEGEGFEVRVELRHGSAAVGDATVQAHIGHGKDKNDVAFARDTGADGVYTGTLKFEHAGKETFHVGIMLPNAKKEWLVRVAVRVVK